MSLIDHIKQLAHRYFDESFLLEDIFIKILNYRLRNLRHPNLFCSVLDKYQINYAKGIVKTGIIKQSWGKILQKKNNINMCRI